MNILVADNEKDMKLLFEQKFRTIGEASVKNKNEPITVYEVLN